MLKEALAGITAALGKAGLVLDNGATTYDIGTAFAFAILGKAYSKATVSNGASPTAQADGTPFTDLAADQACVLVWCVNSGGTVGVFQGEVQAVDPDTDVAKTACPFPSIPDAWCPFAYAKIQTNGAATFDIGSENWNKAGVTKAVVDVITLPDRPATDTAA